jgi:hypothetical protein
VDDEILDSLVKTFDEGPGLTVKDSDDPDVQEAIKRAKVQLYIPSLSQSILVQRRTVSTVVFFPCFTVTVMVA